jgi:DNA-directed RNA polymerase specialized sigma24 family protein
MDKDSGALTSTAARPASQLERMRGSVYRFVFALVGDPDLAGEIAEEVVAEAAQDVERGLLSLEAAGSDEPLRSLLFGRAYRRAAAVRRTWERADSRQGLPVTQPDRAYDPISFDDPSTESATLHAALGALQRDDAACLLLSVVEGFHMGQIALMLELAPDAARKRLMLAKRYLRDAYFARRVGAAAASPTARD